MRLYAGVIGVATIPYKILKITIRLMVSGQVFFGIYIIYIYIYSIYSREFNPGIYSIFKLNFGYSVASEV